MQNKNKPLLLRPSGKDYLWGGSRLNDEFEKNIDMDPLAETWECSPHPDGPSYVVSGEFGGQELAEVLNYTDADSCKKSMEKVKAVFQKAVETAVEEKLIRIRFIP